MFTAIALVVDRLYTGIRAVLQGIFTDFTPERFIFRSRLM
jgi:hypothetical protein